MEEWKTYTASDFCIKVTDGTHDSPKPKDSGHYLITSKHLKDNCIDFSLAYRISEEDYQKIIKRSNVVQHDILFSMIGTIGNIVRITAPIVDFAVKNMAIFKMGGNELKSKWLYYWLQSPSAKEYIASRLAGSTQAYLTLDSIRQYPISSPSEVEMKRIVDILQSIDDKIEINNRINHNLEQQAQIVFDRIFNSDLTNNCLLSSIVDINPKRTLRKNEVARCIDMTYLNTAGSFPSGWEFKPYSGGMKFINGDTLMARITPCLENGKVAYINFLDKEETAFGSTEYIVFHAKEGYPNEMFYFLTRNKAFIEFATKNMNGSSGRQRVSGETIGNYIIPVLSEDDIHELKTVCVSTMKEILKNNLESRVLSEMRNTILPKLMSGELKINDLTC